MYYVKERKSKSGKNPRTRCETDNGQHRALFHAKYNIYDKNDQLRRISIVAARQPKAGRTPDMAEQQNQGAAIPKKRRMRYGKKSYALYKLQESK